jgi:TRAP-type C4-dicarboxylate transport system substrate-binding protein
MRFKSLIGAAAAATMIAAPAVATEFIYSSHTPDTYPDNAYTAKRFFERVEEMTGGEHKARIVGGGALAKGGAALSAVKSGAVDTTILVYNYTPSDIPVLGLLGDLYSTDARVAGPATSETMLLGCPECKEEMKKQNIVVLFNTSSPPYNLLCTNDRVQSLADAKGLKIRAVGSFGPLAASIGATPVNITYGEIYEALQRGQIDCAMNDASQVKALQLDFLKYVTEVPLGTFQSIGFIVVNRDVWNGFSAEQKTAWLKSSAQGVADFEREFTGRVDAAKGVATGEYGTEFVTPDADLMEAVSSYRASETPSLVERAKDRGVKDPETIIASFQAATAKWEKIIAEIGEGDWNEEQWATYADRVYDEIFSKAEF